MSFPCLCLAGVCFSGGHIDQLHHYDSLFRPTASGPQHILPCMDCLAPLFWKLEHHHDSFPLLQGRHDFPWIPPFSKIRITRFCSTTNSFTNLGLN